MNLDWERTCMSDLDGDATIALRLCLRRFLHGKGYVPLDVKTSERLLGSIKALFKNLGF